jgi:uncharacterized protein YjbI with pentapeptide repeats
MAELTRQQLALVLICAGSQPPLAGLDLCALNLSGTDLKGANLSSTKLTTAKLAGADLRNATLGAADLTGANLAGANLSGVGFYVFFMTESEGSTAFQHSCHSLSEWPV